MLAVIGAAMVILVVVRKAEFLSRHLAAVLDGVARTSRGDVYFLVAIVMLFALSCGSRNWLRFVKSPFA